MVKRRAWNDMERKKKKKKKKEYTLNKNPPKNYFSFQDDKDLNIFEILIDYCRGYSHSNLYSRIHRLEFRFLKRIKFYSINLVVNPLFWLQEEHCNDNPGNLLFCSDCLDSRNHRTQQGRRFSKCFFGFHWWLKICGQS